jgi:hypothetical protein
MQIGGRRWWVWLALPLAALALAAGTVGLALEASPRVAGAPAADAEAVQHLRRWLRWHDPRRARDGRLYVIQATAADLQLLAGQAARLAGGAADVTLGAGTLRLQASLPLADAWINLDLRLGDGPTLPTIERLQVGDLALPGWLAEPALQLALRWWDRPRDGTPPLHRMVQGTRWQVERGLVVYRWRADLPQRVGGWLVPAPQVARLRIYHDALIGTLRLQRGPQELPALLTPMFALARQRSAEGGDAAAENRAALLTLAAYASGRPLDTLLPAARGWPPAPRRALLLAGRWDFPLHYLISAALAAEGSGALSDALGLVKEVGDARYGSGFSFNDIAVNRAGTRLGLLAVQDPHRVQMALAAGSTARSLLPDLSDLPEFLPEAEFLARYGGVDAPAYRQLLADIEARLGALPLYH